MPLHCLIVEDHPVLSSGLSTLIRTRFPDAEISCAETVSKAVNIVGDNSGARIDLAILDLTLPDQPGLTLLRHFGQIPLAHPVRTLVVTGAQDDRRKEICKSQGAHGFVAKHSTSEEILEAIVCVSSGGTYFPGLEDDGFDDGETNPFLKLTERKRDLVDLALAGLANRDIAEIMGITPGTARNYLEAIRKELKVPSKLQLQPLAAALFYHPTPVEEIRERYRNTA